MAATHDNDNDGEKYTIRSGFRFVGLDEFLPFSEIIKVIELPMLEYQVSQSMTFYDVFEYVRDNYPPLNRVKFDLLKILFENKLLEIKVNTSFLHEMYVHEEYFDMTLADFEQQQIKMFNARIPYAYRSPLENEFRPAYLIFVMSSEKREQTPIKSARKTAAALLKRFDGDIESAAQMVANYDFFTNKTS